MGAESKIEGEALTLIDALALALPKLEGAKKNANNPAFKSKYADLGAVIEAVRPIAEHGVWFLQETRENDRGAHVETFFIGHGDKISAGSVFIPAAKDNAHGFGSALTYARRYGLQTAFGLPVEDDDGNAAAAAPPKQAKPISDADWALLVQLIENTGTDTEKLCKAYNVGSLKEMTEQNFKDARSVLERRLATKTKEAENA